MQFVTNDRIDRIHIGQDRVHDGLLSWDIESDGQNKDLFVIVKIVNADIIRRQPWKAASFMRQGLILALFKCNAYYPQ